jgi:hypothetical protein
MTWSEDRSGSERRKSRLTEDLVASASGLREVNRRLEVAR